MIDIIALLEENDIKYHTGGKNVTSGWVEINCPFCSDPSYHLGINLTSGFHHCWICGAKGKSERLIQHLLGISYSQAKQIAEDFNTNQNYEEKTKTVVSSIKYPPKGTEKDFPFAHRQYLQKRNFDPNFLIEKYNIKACLQLGGSLAYRVIIPIVIDKQIVSYTGRDITGEQESKYKHLNNEESIIPVKDCLYNIDTVNNKIVLVEGVMDVWRIGDGCSAMFGMEYTTHQLNILFSKEIKEAYVLFDGEKKAIKKAHKLANTLSTFIPKVHVLELDDGDPADMNEDEVRKLREEIEL